MQPSWFGGKKGGGTVNTSSVLSSSLPSKKLKQQMNYKWRPSDTVEGKKEYNETMLGLYFFQLPLSIVKLSSFPLSSTTKWDFALDCTASKSPLRMGFDFSRCIKQTQMIEKMKGSIS